jgi:hypothetical protein
VGETEGRLKRLSPTNPALSNQASKGSHAVGGRSSRGAGLGQPGLAVGGAPGDRQPRPDQASARARRRTQRPGPHRPASSTAATTRRAPPRPHSASAAGRRRRRPGAAPSRRPRPAGGRAPALASSGLWAGWSTRSSRGSSSAPRSRPEPRARPAQGAATVGWWPRTSALSSSRRRQVEHQADQALLQCRQVEQRGRTAQRWPVARAGRFSSIIPEYCTEI